MGSIYRPKYKDRHGAERESAVWWIQYYSHGRKIRESTAPIGKRPGDGITSFRGPGNGTPGEIQ